MAIKDLTGQRFGRLVVEYATEQRFHRSIVWHCKCDCGNTIDVPQNYLSHGLRTDCGCITTTHNYEDITGKRFNYLTVLEKTTERKNAAAVWKCQCDCGKIVFAIRYDLTSGRVKSCGRNCPARKPGWTGKRAPVVLPRICRQCGVTFEGGPRAWYCPDCRAERQKEASRRAKQKGRPERAIGSTDQCVICGKDYVVKSARQKYCPDCAKDAVREIDKKASLEWKKANPDKIKKSNKEFIKRNNGRTRKKKWLNNIRKLRLKKGLTQKALGEMVGATQSKISYWESGNARPIEENLDKLAIALGCTIKQLGRYE